VPQREPNKTFLALARQVRDAMAADHEKRIGPIHAGFCDAIERHLPDERVVVCDATMTGNSWGAFRLAVRQARAYTYSTSLAIGPALPLGLGAAIGSGRTTVVIHGDGGVMLNLGELATAVETNAPLIVLIFNNQGYGVLRSLQDMLKVPHVAVDLHTPDFAAIGLAMGLASSRVADVESFDRAFAEAVARNGPSLIEIDLTGISEPGL
jgi:acetolactate synthase-1/2/3 large subunit